MNFDKAVAQLRQEARHLLRMGAAVPAAARAVLLQDEKLSAYRARLTFLVKVSLDRRINTCLRPDHDPVPHCVPYLPEVLVMNLNVS